MDFSISGKNIDEMRNKMKITKETIDYVANLVKLSLTEKEKVQFTKDLNSILNYMDTMNEINTDNIKPLTHVLPLKNRFRHDIDDNSNDRAQLLSNAPSQINGSFQVPKTVV